MFFQPCCSLVKDILYGRFCIKIIQIGGFADNTGNLSVIIKKHSVESLYQDCHLPKSLSVCSDFSPFCIFTMRVWSPQ